MTTDVRDPWGWVGADRPPSRDFKPVWLAPLSYLIPMPEGAVLRWVYDEDDDVTYSLLVRLTETEAQTVFESDRRSGMLESVRPTLSWRGSLVTISGEYGRPFPSWRYFIQPDTPEDEFVRDLMSPPIEIVRNAVLEAGARSLLTPQERRDSEFATSMIAGAAA
jgi:hypothetical protein